MVKTPEDIVKHILGKGKTTEDITKDMISNDNENRCVLCGKEYHGYGHNAEPVKKGYCCDDCNMMKVIPLRLKQSRGGK